MKPLWVILLLEIAFVISEVVEIPNLTMYHVTPQTQAQMRYLNRLRTADSGILFINGVGAVGETMAILAQQSAMDIYEKDFNDIKLIFHTKFNPVTIEMLNDEVVKKDPDAKDPLTAAAAAEYNKTAEGFFPIEHMASTNVFSGIFLHISPSSKRLKNVDVLTFGTKLNSTMGNPYLCLATTKSDDEYDSAKQWTFEKTETSGYYALRNRKLSNGYVTWEDDDEQYLVIETRREFQRMYRKDGALRPNVLFKVTRANDMTGNQIGYTITVKGMDRQDTHIVMEPAWKDATGCYFLRRTFREVSADGGKLEYTFKVEQANTAMKVVGIIEDIKYDVNVEELYMRAVDAQTVTTLTSMNAYNNRNYPLRFEIKEAHERKDRFRLKLGDGGLMLAFDELWAPPGLSIGTTINLNDTDEPAMIKINTDKDNFEKCKYSITAELEVPPWNSVQYNVVFGYLEKFTLGFNAMLKIVGRGDRMTMATKPRVITDQLMNFGYVYDVLLRRGYKLDPKSNDPTKMEGYTPIKGIIIASALGIKGDVQVTFKHLSKNITTTCHTPHTTYNGDDNGEQLAP